MNFNDKMKSAFLIFLIFLIISSVSAEEYADPWSETEFYDLNSDYYNTEEPNHIIIEFDGDANCRISTPDNSYYQSMINEIYVCIHDQALNITANATTLKNEVKKICQSWGIDNPDVEISSPYGDDSFFYIGLANGISMEPTIKDGSKLVINKSRDFKVGDIVSAYYHPEHIDILKRVKIINGDNVYLVSDNVNGTYVKDGKVYEYEGVRAWVNMSDIKGVLIDAYPNNDSDYEGYNPDVITL